MDEDSGREGREGRHAEIIGSGGGGGDEHDFVPKQSGVQQGRLAFLHVGIRAEDCSDGIGGVDPIFQGSVPVNNHLLFCGQGNRHRSESKFPSQKRRLIRSQEVARDRRGDVQECLIPGPGQ